jgi:hypothetical protein
MFLLRTRLWKTNNFSLNVWALPTYGNYWWKKLHDLLTLIDWKNKGFIFQSSLLISKFFLIKLFFNPELDKSLIDINKKIKQSIFSYEGLWLLLNLPVWGQRTKTNASTQRLLSGHPWKRHFIQKWNWRKFNVKDQKKIKKINK